jgi:hypothetical protein
VSAFTYTFRADVSGTAFGGAPTWTDLSAYVLAEGQGGAVDITWGRQDEDGTVTPSVMKIVVDNADGRFTPKRSSSPYFPFFRSGMRANFRGIFNAVTYDRFDGLLDTIEQAWPGGSEGWSVVLLTFVDISVRLAADQPLRSMYIQECLVDAPTYLYPLGEAAGSVSAGSVTTGVPVATRLDGKFGPGSVTFGTDMGLSDTATGVSFAASGTPGNAPNAVSVLSIANGGNGGPTAPNAAFTIECWAIMPTVIPTAGFGERMLTQEGGPFPDGTSNYIHLDVASGVGNVDFAIYDGTTIGAVLASGSMCDGLLHHFVGTVASDMRTVKLYVDGVLIGTTVAAAAVNLAGLTRNHIGGRNTYKDTGVGNQFQGTLSHVALYPSALSAARVLVHYQMGIGSFTELSSARFARIAGYGNVPTSGLPTGIAVMGAQKTAGKTALSCLQDIGRTENSPVFVTGAGALTFQARNTRYNATAALSLVADDVDPGISPREDRTDLTNDITVTRDGGAAQRFTDATSQQAYGISNPGDFTVSCSTDFDALQNAAWQVTINKDSHLRVPAMLVDLKTQTSTTKIANALAATLSTLMNLSGMPANGPASSLDFFIEGGHETWGLGGWGIEFYTSPNIPATLRADGTATTRTKLDNGLKIPF